MKSVIHLNTNLQLFDFLHLVGQNWILKKKKEQEVSNEIEILWIQSGINDVSVNDDETYQSRRETRRRERRRPSLQQRNPYLRSLRLSVSSVFGGCRFYGLSNPAPIGHEHVDVILLPYVAVNEMHIHFWSTTLHLWIHWANVVIFFPSPITSNYI